MIHGGLYQALVANQQQLPATRSRKAFVAQPPKIPHMFRFGPVQPGPEQNSAFTGGRVQNPMSSLTHPQIDNGTQQFTAPTFGGGPTAPTLAPLVSTPQGGEPTHPVPGAGDNTGASPAPPGPPQTPSVLSTLISRGYAPVDSIDYANPGRQVSTTPVNGLANTYEGSLPTPQTPSTLATILAFMGQKPNPSALTGPTRFQF